MVHQLNSRRFRLLKRFPSKALPVCKTCLAGATILDDRSETKE